MADARKYLISWGLKCQSTISNTRVKARGFVDIANKKISAVSVTAKNFLRLAVARAWQSAYKFQYAFSVYKNRYGSIFMVSAILFCIAVSVFFRPALQIQMEAHYLSEPEIAGLSAMILNLGSALIGAAAIVTSLVLFAMQVNIERMPHGLFRRLSADPKLLVYFALSFIMAICVTIISTFVNKEYLAIVALSTLWAVVGILTLFLAAYRRALMLINPLQQIKILANDARKDLYAWARRAERANPIFEQAENLNVAPLPADIAYDLPRITYFKINSNWTANANRAIRHAMSFARHYAEKGDYEVSNAALNAVVNINAVYVKAKGKTFFSVTPFFDSGLSVDGFINNTLEQLRQNSQIGIAARDELQIEQTLKAISNLVHLYSEICYSDRRQNKIHASIHTILEQCHPAFV